LSKEKGPDVGPRREELDEVGWIFIGLVIVICFLLGWLFA